MGADLRRARRASPNDGAADLLDGGTPFYDVYETADGKHLSVGALEPQFYAELVRLLGLEGDAPDRDDPANHAAAARAAHRHVRGRTQAEWAEVFDGTDACVAPVIPTSEAVDHPHLAARGTFVEHRRHHPARARSALLAHAGRGGLPPGGPRRRTPARRSRPGGSTTSTG